MIVTLFATNIGISTGKCKCRRYPQDAEDDSTHIKTGRTKAGYYFLVKWGVSKASVKSLSFIDNDDGALYALLSDIPLSVSCNNRIPIHLYLRNGTKYAHSGKIVLKLYKSPIPDPGLSDITPITDEITSPEISFSATAGEIKECFFTPILNFTLNNEYLVAIINWYITKASTGATTGVVFLINGERGSFVDVVW